MRLNGLCTRAVDVLGSMVDGCPLDVDSGEGLGAIRPMPGIRVLVADLSLVIAETSAMILNQSGFSAFPAISVSQAVSIAHANAIDVAILELLIGDTNAIDAARRILAIRPYCRIIIWTGRDEPVLSWVRREADVRFGGCDLLCKPVHPQDLIPILRGEPIPHGYDLPYKSQGKAPVCASDYLSGPELHRYLRAARECMLNIMREEHEAWLRRREPRGRREHIHLSSNDIYPPWREHRQYRLPSEEAG